MIKIKTKVLIMISRIAETKQYHGILNSNLRNRRNTFGFAKVVKITRYVRSV